MGNVRYRPFSVENRKWTSGVWAEPEIIDGAYYEFSADTATYVFSNYSPVSVHLGLIDGPLLFRYLAAAEDTLTPYRFSVYDLLVLPPSFPYGGMVS